MLETVESINANHMQMAKCQYQSDESYRVIAGVLKQFLRNIRPETSLSVGTATNTQQGGTHRAHQAKDMC